MKHKKLLTLSLYDNQQAEYEFIERVAQDVVNGFLDEEKECIINNTEADYHFTLGLYIRNKYIHGKPLEFFYLCADDLSTKIVERVIEKLKEGHYSEKGRDLSDC